MLKKGFYLIVYNIIVIFDQIKKSLS